MWQKVKPCQIKSTIDPSEWDWCPTPVCISLIERDDRYTAASETFHSVGLQKKMNFYRPKRDTSASSRRGIRGCWESHRAVAQWGLENNFSSLLVFEDDVIFDEKLSASTVNNVKKMYNLLPNKWNMFFLGHWNITSKNTKYANMKKVHSLCLHAYIISKKMMQWWVNHPFDGFGEKRIFDNTIDIHTFWQPHCYAYYPMICFQSNSKSDSLRKQDGIVTLALTKKWMKNSENTSHYCNELQYLLLLMILFAIARIGFGTIKLFK